MMHDALMIITYIVFASIHLQMTCVWSIASGTVGLRCHDGNDDEGDNQLFRY
jgi:hypothetical protein